MRRAIAVSGLIALTVACSGHDGSGPSSTLPSSVEPVDLPSGTPPSYPQDVDAVDLPIAQLVPEGTTPTDAWPAIAPDGTQFAVIAFAAPSDDPFRQEHGLVVWRRSEDTPPWRAVMGLSDPVGAGVLEVHALIGDATGDGSPDAITFEGTGGSGACGTWRVLDLAANTEVFTRQTCDTTTDLSTDPVGLVVREAVFAPGDAHCCPSATTVSVLTFDGMDWSVASSTELPT